MVDGVHRRRIVLDDPSEGEVTVGLLKHIAVQVAGESDLTERVEAGEGFVERGVNVGQINAAGEAGKDGIEDRRSGSQDGRSLGKGGGRNRDGDRSDEQLNFHNIHDLVQR